MSTLTIQIDANTENGLRLLSAEGGKDISEVAARLLARAVSLETPEVLKTFIGRVTAIEDDAASIDMRDADDDEPYVMQYDAATLLALNINAGDPVECKLVRRNGKTEVVFAAISKCAMSAKERKQMYAELEAKYAQFPAGQNA